MLEVGLQNIICEDILLADWEHINMSECEPRNTNIAVGAFVTACVRLELNYKIAELEKIRPGCVLFHETDSIICNDNSNNIDTQCGDFLGEHTNEIQASYGVGAKHCSLFHLAKVLLL